MWSLVSDIFARTFFQLTNYALSLLLFQLTPRVNLVREVDGWRKSLPGVWIFAAGTHQFLGDPDSSFSIFHSILYSEYVKTLPRAHNSPDHHLHSPMYFLLANFSFIDTGVSALQPQRWFLTFSEDTKSSPWEAASLRCSLFTLSWGCRDGAAHSHGLHWYVAICKPLHYLTIMSLRMCSSLLAVAWPLDSSTSGAQLAFVVNLPFCGPNEMDSFYCDFPRFIKLACTDTYRLEFLGSLPTVASSSPWAPSCILMVSYIFILVTVRKTLFRWFIQGPFYPLSSHHCGSFFPLASCIIVYVWPFPTLPIDKFLAIFDVLITFYESYYLYI